MRKADNFYIHISGKKWFEKTPHEHFLSAVGTDILNMDPVATDDGISTCRYCGEKVPRVFMTDHRRLVHKDDMRHECDICGRRFHRKFVMMNHRRIHTGEKPFCCKTCKERFTTRSHMIQHSHKEGHYCD